MKQFIQIRNRSISELTKEEGLVEALSRIHCNENLSFISSDYKIGDKTVIHKFVNIFGKGEIGRNCIISSFVEIQNSVKLGNNCRVGSHSFLCSGLELGDNVFLGSHFCSLNDRYPKSHNKEYKQEKTIIKNNVSIGSGTTLMCGISIGENSIIGAKSLVLENIPDRLKFHHKLVMQ